jgi:hypothetical protein
MRIQDRYILSLAATYTATNFIFSFYATTLDLYASVFIVEYFIVTLLHSPLNPKTQKITNRLSYILFSVFLVIVTLKVLQILGASPI